MLLNTLPFPIGISTKIQNIKFKLDFSHLIYRNLLENNSYYSYYNELLEEINRDIQSVRLKGFSTANTQI